MNQGKRKKRVSTDEEKCEVISNAISHMIASSENEDFVSKCRRIIQWNTQQQMKDKLKKTFMDATAIKKTTNTETSTDSKKQSDSFDSFMESLENTSSNVWEELEGFDKWED